MNTINLFRFATLLLISIALIVFILFVKDLPNNSMLLEEFIYPIVVIVNLIISFALLLSSIIKNSSQNI